MFSFNTKSNITQPSPSSNLWGTLSNNNKTNSSTDLFNSKGSSLLGNNNNTVNQAKPLFNNSLFNSGAQNQTQRPVSALFGNSQDRLTTSQLQSTPSFGSIQQTNGVNLFNTNTPMGKTGPQNETLFGPKITPNQQQGMSQNPGKAGSSSLFSPLWSNSQNSGQKQQQQQQQKQNSLFNIGCNQSLFNKQNTTTLSNSPQNLVFSNLLTNTGKPANSSLFSSILTNNQNIPAQNQQPQQNNFLNLGGNQGIIGKPAQTNPQNSLFPNILGTVQPNNQKQDSLFSFNATPKPLFQPGPSQQPQKLFQPVNTSWQNNNTLKTDQNQSIFQGTLNLSQPKPNNKTQPSNQSLFQPNLHNSSLSLLNNQQNTWMTQQKPLTTSNQTAGGTTSSFQNSSIFSRGSQQPDINVGSGLNLEFVPFSSIGKTGTFNELGAKLLHSDEDNNSGDSTVNSESDLPYNPFEVHNRKNPSRFSQDFSHQYFSPKDSRKLTQKEEIEIISYKTKKELTARDLSLDLIKELKSQKNHHDAENLTVDMFENSAVKKEKKSLGRAKEQEILLYIKFLEAKETERTFSVEVNLNISCLELKKSVLDLIFEFRKVNASNYVLHSNGKALEESKKLKDLPINNSDYLILENIRGANQEEDKPKSPVSKIVAPELLPKFNPEHHFEPNMMTLSCMTEEELANVKGFCIYNDQASIKFEEGVDLRGLDLSEIVILGHKNVEVYPEGGRIPLPEVGKGLNKRAKIEFYNWSLPEKYSKTPEVYLKKLEDWAEKMNAKLVSFDSKEKKAVIAVENFKEHH